jgi:hypothetical protein
MTSILSRLDVALKKLEGGIRSPKGLKQTIKSYNSNKRVAKQISWKIQHLHHDVRVSDDLLVCNNSLYDPSKVASDNGIFAELLKKKNLTSDGQPMPRRCYFSTSDGSDAHSSLRSYASSYICGR